MNLLLDTHAFLWFIDGNKKLSKKARQAIEDSGNAKSVSNRESLGDGHQDQSEEADSRPADRDADSLADGV